MLLSPTPIAYFNIVVRMAARLWARDHIGRPIMQSLKRCITRDYFEIPKNQIARGGVLGQLTRLVGVCALLLESHCANTATAIAPLAIDAVTAGNLKRIAVLHDCARHWNSPAARKSWCGR
jgi:hypothetical protein